MNSKLIYKGIEILFLKDKTIFKSSKFNDTVFITYKPFNEKTSINLIDKGHVMFTGRENTYADLSRYFNTFGYIDTI